MDLRTKRFVTACVLVSAAWMLGPGIISAAAVSACDHGGMIGSGTITC
jgi:hypothetical protein